MLASTVGNGLVAKTTDQNGVETVVGFDSTGNQTLTLESSTGTSYSWKGDWDSLVGSGLANVALPVSLQAASLWAFPEGSPSGANEPGRLWYFILNWQNAFDFFPDVPSARPDMKVDIIDKATVIKAAALAALKEAYSDKSWRVVVVEGTPNTGDHQAVVQTKTTDQGSSCGTTDLNKVPPNDSEVWYECNMKEAQVALQIVIKRVTPTITRPVEPRKQGSASGFSWSQWASGNAPLS
jgi:hypothetical protein